MNKEQDQKEQTTQTANCFLPFIPAGITWFAGFLFLQQINVVFVWWTLVCVWFPLYYAMTHRYPGSKKKWSWGNIFAITLLLVFPFLFCLLFVAVGLMG